MEVIADVGLTHSHTDGERCVGLCGIFSGEGSHGVVNHSHLRSVAVGYDDLMAFFYEIHNGFRCDLNSCHLFRQSIAQGIAAQSDDDSFFIHCKFPLKIDRARDNDACRTTARAVILFI